MEEQRSTVRTPENLLICPAGSAQPVSQKPRGEGGVVAGGPGVDLVGHPAAGPGRAGAGARQQYLEGVEFTALALLGELGTGGVF